MAADILKQLMPMVSRSGVFKVLKRLRYTRSSAPRVRATPQSKIITPRLIKTVRQKIARNLARGNNQLAKEAGIMRGTMRNLVKKDLGIRPYKKTKCQLPSAAIRAKRLARAKFLCKELQSAPHSPVIWLDEKLFTVQAIHNVQNDRVYGKCLDSIPVEVRTTFCCQKPTYIMVWTAVTSDGHRSPLSSSSWRESRSTRLCTKTCWSQRCFHGFRLCPREPLLSSSRTRLPCIQPRRHRLGARKIFMGSGMLLICGLHQAQTSIPWTFPYGPSWRGKPVPNHTSLSQPSSQPFSMHGTKLMLTPSKAPAIKSLTIFDVSLPPKADTVQFDCTNRLVFKFSF